MSVARFRPGSLGGRATAPGSKSYTHRFLLAAHLARRAGRIRRPLVSDDTVRTAQALRPLGSHVRFGKELWTVTPCSPRGGRPSATVDCGESGTTLRLVTAIAALGTDRVRFVGSGRLPRRPIDPLLNALIALGATVRRSSSQRSLPFSIRGPIRGGTVDLPVEESSQFTSALLLALPTVRPGSRLRTVGTPVSVPYVDATLAVVRSRGVRVSTVRSGYLIPGGQRYRTADATVPGDASSAAYLWAAAAVTGGRVRVDGVPKTWPQADLAVLALLRQYGAEVARTGDAITVEGGERRPFRLDLDDAPDLYPLAGVLAATCPGRSVLLGAAHVAAKESDRKVGTARLARALGARVQEVHNGLAIEGTRRPRALTLRSLTDHRLVMSAAVGALSAEGPSVISDAGAVAKSFPDFFDALAGLGVEVTIR